jgi:hypothetical protein
MAAMSDVFVKPLGESRTARPGLVSPVALASRTIFDRHDLPRAALPARAPRHADRFARGPQALRAFDRLNSRE